MKYLLIDMGHSKTKMALYTDDKKTRFAKLDSGSPKDILNTLNEWSNVDKVLVASVHKNGKKIVSKIPNSKLIRISDVPMDCCYNKNELGIDRLLAAFAASKLTSSPLIIASFGSAITVDFVNESNAFCGGVIAPGIDSMFKALENIDKCLHSKTAPPRVLIGTSTKESVRNGVFLSAKGLVESAKQRWLKNKSCPIFITGGWGELVLPFLDKHKIEYHPNLVIEGLRLIASS